MTGRASIPIGNAALVNSRVISTQPVKLLGFTIYSAQPNCWALVFNSATLPANGTVPDMPPFPIPAGTSAPGQLASFNMPGDGIDFDACTIAISSTPNTLTVATDNPALTSIQGVVAR